MAKIFKLLVRSRDGVQYDGDVVALSSFNDEGEFDILSEHANFISLVNKALIIREPQGNKKKINIEKGLLRTKHNKVEVYLGVESEKGLRAKKNLNI
jgi:F0F1-type ATP synthase epsilon subunit